MKHFALTYHYVKDYMARREVCRAQHLARIQEAVDRGRILAAGVLPKEPGALIVFYAESIDEVLDFAENDPYNKAGLIAAYQADEWLVAAGAPAVVDPTA